MALPYSNSYRHKGQDIRFQSVAALLQSKHAMLRGWVRTRL
ncbi:hypothetical protein AVDCRST_MAG94-4616 [uncultured Leptolyngbya sp.]|uniref:Uncharacterized protein n=1 Tax=uncultured Leptolyngbya sp. TaxID=332963 RepID=A0A6J4N479_9CYAN|nr:hypothetical protein AVDCRST_MAG94-4616 [uncultured Leptolyngbya sp.]